MEPENEYIKCAIYLKISVLRKLIHNQLLVRLQKNAGHVPDKYGTPKKANSWIS